MIADRPEVLVRAADAGDTFIYWTWLGPQSAPQTSRRPASELVPMLAELDAGLLTATLEDDAPDGTTAALLDGPYGDKDREREFATRLTNAVFPADLGAQIAEATDTQGVRVRLSPSPRLARVPWELLLLPDGRRLVEVAQVVHDPPASFYAGRRRQPDNWSEVAGMPALHVVDPQLQHRGGQLLSTEGRRRFAERQSELRAAGRAPATDLPQAPRSDVTRDLLSDALKQRVARLFYLGHISSDPGEPGTAALHLSDTADTCWGVHHPVAANVPLSALDLLLGTTTCDDPQVWRHYLADGPELGDEIWPMPPRVALVACEGSVDFRSLETFGLVIAILNAGAGLVTTTRWPLPTDAAFHSVGVPESVLPTTDLALQVDAAHDADDPIGALQTWQVKQLRSWQQSGDIARSPITWAALTHTWAPRRAPYAQEFSDGGLAAESR